MPQFAGKEKRVARAALCRLLAVAASFGVMWAVLSLLPELTRATKGVMSGLAAVAVLFMGARIWGWVLTAFGSGR